ERLRGRDAGAVHLDDLATRARARDHAYVARRDAERRRDRFHHGFVRGAIDGRGAHAQLQRVAVEPTDPGRLRARLHVDREPDAARRLRDLEHRSLTHRSPKGSARAGSKARTRPPRARYRSSPSWAARDAAARGTTP